MMTEVVPYVPPPSPAPQREKSLWPWFGIYFTCGAVLALIAMGVWWLVNYKNVQWHFWSLASVAVLSIGATVAFALSLWCVQRIVEKYKRQWLVALICSIVTILLMLTPANREWILVAGIFAGTPALLLVGQAMRSAQLAVDRKEVVSLGARIGFGVWIRAALLLQIAIASAVVGAAIMKGFGYPLPF
jgi:hypothetical protein